MHFRVRSIAAFCLFLLGACVEPGQTEIARGNVLASQRKFEEALGAYDAVPRDERAILTYLVGELWRRIGNAEKATKWFESVPSEVVDLQNQQWVMDAAEQQRLNPREWFG